MVYEQLKLENQLCFPVYAASRLITREYQPYLEKLNLTYPQYLALMVLWENDPLTVNEIAEKLILNTNTITPLLKRMESQGLITRQRSSDDERKVLIALTEKGRQLQEEAALIPQSLVNELLSTNLDPKDLIRLKDMLYQLVNFLSDKNKLVS